MSKTFFGVDLGKKGGVVALRDGKIVAKIKMPLIADEEIDIKTIGKFFRAHGIEDCHVVLEKFGGFFGYGKNAAVSLARQSGYIEALLVLMNIPYTRVQPQVWQKVVWEGTKLIVKKDGKKDTKKISLMTATRLFPKVSFLASERSSVPHDGIVDAALLAVFGQRKGL